MQIVTTSSNNSLSKISSKVASKFASKILYKHNLYSIVLDVLNRMRHAFSYLAASPTGASGNQIHGHEVMNFTAFSVKSRARTVALPSEMFRNCKYSICDLEWFWHSVCCQSSCCCSCSVSVCLILLRRTYSDIKLCCREWPQPQGTCCLELPRQQTTC